MKHIKNKLELNYELGYKVNLLNDRISAELKRKDVVLGDPPWKDTMLDSQRYPWNLYLINIGEDIVVFLELKCNLIQITPICLFGHFSTVVSYNINIMKTTFLFKFICKQAFFISQFTSN